MNVQTPHLLIVDDDSRLRELLSRYLFEQSFLITTAVDAMDARRKLENFKFDLVVLDVMMPGESGISLAAYIHKNLQTPVLLLTAKGEVENRIEGLEAGADDYLPKPFEPKELVLRINAILRRAVSREEAKKEIQIGEWLFVFERDELRGGDKRVALTTAEANLLRILAASPGVTFSREELAEKLGLKGSARTVDVQITRLRRKIEPDPSEPHHLQTVRGKGYVLWL